MTSIPKHKQDHVWVNNNNPTILLILTTPLCLFDMPVHFAKSFLGSRLLTALTTTDMSATPSCCARSLARSFLRPGNESRIWFVYLGAPLSRQTPYCWTDMIALIWTHRGEIFANSVQLPWNSPSAFPECLLSFLRL